MLFITFYVLVIARDLLIPLVLAIFIWYVINLIAGQLDRLNIGGRRLPKPVQFLAAGLAMAGVIWLLVTMVTSNVSQVIAAAPDYQANLERLLEDWSLRFGFEEPPALANLVENINLGGLVRSAATALGGVLGNAGLILVYLLFLFLEQRYFGAKMRAIFPDSERRHEVHDLLLRIQSDVRTYVGIKASVSALTAIVSYLIMAAIGLDFAAFWAVLIFILNFIPNIGSLVATLLPAVMALIQFDTLTPFMVVVIGVGASQILVGSVLEPNLMGKSLNISPLVVMLSLVLWGVLWGIPGMFLCVPITVILMIVLYHFENTRWIALLLSQDGKLRSTSVE